MVIIENKKNIKFTIDVKEYDQYVKIDIAFEDFFEYCPDNIHTPQNELDSLTIGVFPANYWKMPLEEQNDWYKNMPLIHITYNEKYSSAVYYAFHNNINSFVVLSQNE